MRDLAHGPAPSRLILTLGLFLGLMFLVFNPPFGVNDEDVHLARIFELASGRLLSLSDISGEYHYVPADYRDLGGRYQGIGRHEGGRVNLRELLEHLGAGRPQGPLVRMAGRASGYPPIAYGLQVPLIWLAKHLDVGVLWHLYLARTASLVVYIFLAWRAVVIAGPLHWLFLVVALLPMALTQAAGVSGDGLVNGLSLVLFALVAKGSILAQRLSPVSLIGLVACLVVLGLCKAVYAVAGLSFLCLRWSGPRSQLTRWSFLLGACALTAGCIYTWMYLNRDVGAAAPGGRLPAVQLAWLLSEPWRTACWAFNNALAYVDELLIESTFVRYRISHGMRFVGAVSGVLCAQLLLSVAWGASRKGSTAQPRQRRRIDALIFAATWLAITLAVPSALYLCCNGVGAPNLRGFHGRYLIPAIPPLLLALSLLGRPVLARWLRLRPRLVLSVLVTVNLLSQFSLIGWHYYSPSLEWPL